VVGFEEREEERGDGGGETEGRIFFSSFMERKQRLEWLP